MNFCLMLGLVLLASGCVSNQDRFSDNLAFESTDGIGKLVEAQAQQGLSAKMSDGYALEWFSCTRKVKGPYILMLNPGNEVYKPDACKSGMVQAFLQQDYNVLAVNRPGFGQSEGKEVIGDDLSLASLRALLKAQLDMGKAIEGLWGFEEASVLAFRIARDSKLKVLIIGNGLYDWEATLQDGKDLEFIRKLQQLQASQDEAGRFAELRSIAWDFNGLPKSVYLYHVKNDPRFPDSQAEAFRAALAANQYQVKLIELKDDRANLTPVVHQSVLIQISELEKPSSK